MTDEHWMRQAVSAAARVAGQTGDNPAVGCVVVADGVVVSEGATQFPPGPHAEVVAVRAAETIGADLHRCTLYVTLEPCAFHGRTPPCAELIAARRPARVVVAVRDPHPRVNGAGIAALRAAGIDVTEGVLEKEAAAALADWLGQFRRRGD